jgi:hypothetical protein
MVKRAASDMQGRPREIEAFSNFPAYRATLLSFRRGGTKSPLTFLIYLKQFVTLPIASFPKFTGRKIGQSGRKTGRN